MPKKGIRFILVSSDTAATAHGFRGVLLCGLLQCLGALGLLDIRLGGCVHSEIELEFLRIYRQVHPLLRPASDIIPSKSFLCLHAASQLLGQLAAPLGSAGHGIKAHIRAESVDSELL